MNVVLSASLHSLFDFFLFIPQTNAPGRRPMMQKTATAGAWLKAAISVFGQFCNFASVFVSIEIRWFAFDTTEQSQEHCAGRLDGGGRQGQLPGGGAQPGQPGFGETAECAGK